VQRLESLASNLLDLTQYEHADLKLEQLNVEQIVAEAVELATPTAEAKQIKLESSLKPDKVVGQYDSLVQLLSIILDNAIKYSPKKTTIKLTGSRSAGEYQLRVRDQGPGIAAHDLPHIFERLYRGDKSRTASSHGYGLGLSLAQEIAKANHAAITAHNYRGGGAEFMISLGLA